MANKKKELAEGMKIGKKAVEDKNKELSPPEVDAETKEKLEKMEPKANNVAQVTKEAKMPKEEKKEPSLENAEPKKKEPEVETKKESEVVETNETEAEPEVTEELQKKLFETDEGQIAEDAIESKDISKVENIVDPDTNEPFVLPTYDKDGRVTALKPLVPENAELYSKKTGIFLTVLSFVVSALSGGVIPALNFVNMRWDEAKNKAAALENEIIRIYNGEIDESNKKLIETRGTEQALESASENKDIYNKENAQDLARAKAAEQGNTGLEQTQISATTQKDIAELNADLAKQLKGMDIDWNRDALQLTQEQQIKMAELLYDQEVQKTINQIKAMKEQGYSIDDIAKQVSSQQGMTTLARGLGYAEQGGSIIGNIISAIMPAAAKSDKNVKKFDAKPVNNTMLKSAFKWR